LFGLLGSTAFAEIAGGAVFVALVERAYELGSGTASVGVVLLVQSATQALLGFWAGGLADTWGQRKTAGLVALAVAGLAIGLAFAETILHVYILAFLLMMARLLLIPARFGLVARVTGKSRFVDANTTLALLSGAGSFIGPAMVTVLLLVSDNLRLPLLVAGVGSLLSIPPLVLIKIRSDEGGAAHELNVWTEMRLGWRVIGKRITIRQVLLCLINITLLLGAVMPLFTPLARRFGFGSEGTGVFFTALGFGYLIGPFVATALFKRMRLSTALFIAGLLGPIGVMLIGVVQNLEVVLVAVGLIAVTSAGINVMVTTVVQRLSPRDQQGSVIGVQQALVGLAWTISLATTTGVTAVWENVNIQLLFLVLGAFGFLAILGCWLWSKRSLRFACDMCQTSSRTMKLACWVSRN
jgi:MFS family permease